MNPSAQTHRLLGLTLRFARKKRIRLYIVGGFLRDILLKRARDNMDIDFCLKAEAISFGRSLSRHIKAGFVVLDKGHGACRLVKKIKNTNYTLDFTDFRAKTLEEDLSHRDFTINTLAVELDKASILRPLDYCIDPCSGRKDIKAGLIRIVNPKAFDEDPLRILRAFSLACIFGFKIEHKTLGLLQAKRHKLPHVSFERIRDELFKILASPCAYASLSKMDQLKVLKVIFPEFELMRNVQQGPYHHLDVWQHSLETVRQMELLIQEFKHHKDIQGYLNTAISSDRGRLSLIKLGALLHDIGKPGALRHKEGKTIFHGHERIGSEFSKNIARRLKLSNDESESLKKMVFWHLRPGYLADNAEITSRARFRYFRDTGLEAVSVLLLSLADQRSTKGPLTTRASRLRHEKTVSSLIKDYFRRQKEKIPARIINGDELIRKFKLEPSPLIGRLLREIEELQAIGRVKTKEDALKIAERLIKN